LIEKPNNSALHLYIHASLYETSARRLNAIISLVIGK